MEATLSFVETAAQGKTNRGDVSGTECTRSSHLTRKVDGASSLQPDGAKSNADEGKSVANSPG